MTRTIALVLGSVLLLLLPAPGRAQVADKEKDTGRNNDLPRSGKDKDSDKNSDKDSPKNDPPPVPTPKGVPPWEGMRPLLALPGPWNDPAPPPPAFIPPPGWGPGCVTDCSTLLFRLDLL